MLRSRRRRSPAAAVTALLLVLVACSGGDGNARAPLPESAQNPATGPPLPVAMINMEGSPLGSFPEVRRAAEAAIRYVNEELGGVHNRPLRLESCTTDGSQSRSQACANQLVGAKPVVVLGGIDVAAGVPILIFQENGIPYVGATPILGRELTEPGSFLLAGGAAAEMLGMADYITNTLKVKKVGVVHADLPGQLDRAIEGAKRVLAEKGVTDVRIVAEKADAADFVPALSAAAANKPDVILAAFGAQGCTRIMQAKQALGITARMFYPSSCLSESVLKAGGAGAEGAYLSTAFLPWPTDDPEVALYRDRMARYAGGEASARSALAQAGFSLVMSVYRALSELGEGNLTGAALKAKLAQADNRPGFMSHSYTCDRRQVILLTAICNPWVRLVQHRDGTLHDLTKKWTNGAGLLELLLS